MNIRFLLFGLIFLIIASCATQKKTKSKLKNVSFLYNPSISQVKFKHKIFHITDTTSVLKIHLNSDDLLIKADDKSKKARVLIKYRIYLDNNKLDFYDSLSTIYNIDFSQKKQIDIDIPLKLKPKAYFFMFTIKDLYRNIKTEEYFLTDKTSKFTKDNFIATSKNNYIKFDNIVKQNDSLHIIYKRQKVDSFFVYYFKNSFKQASLPFSISLVKAQFLTPDSIYKFANNDTSYISFEKEGFYEILADTSQNKGITFFNFGDNFPYIKTPTEMLNPIVYLTSQTEFKKYKQMPNKKIAVDEFWLKTSKNANSAKGLIRVFYNRVKFANIYFTSYKEGWKTDRGMIYIIYGAPSVINKSNKIERWIYSSQNSMMQFTFINKPNIYTDNNFELEHNESYSIFWYKAIDTWRNGRIFYVTQ